MCIRDRLEEEAAYEGQDWAEGEWVEDEAGEMVWKPAEGGEAISAEAWSHAAEEQAEEQAEEATDSADGAEVAPTTEAVEQAAEPVAAESSGDAE